MLGALADVGVEGACEGSGGVGAGTAEQEARRRDHLLARLETEECAARLALKLALALVLAQLPAKKEKAGPAARGRRLAATVGRLERHMDASRRMLLRYQVHSRRVIACALGVL